MNGEKLHIVSVVGDQNPALGSNAKRVEGAAKKITELLQPAGLWVLSGREKETFETAECINLHIGANSLNPGNVVIDNFISENPLDDDGANGWRNDLDIHSSLAFLRSARHRNQEHSTGLVLVTHPDKVTLLPEILGVSGYDAETDTSYSAVNHLEAEVDDLDHIARK